MAKPLEVTISVGTSFSIGGAFNDPEKYKPVGERSVLCGGDGLEFMLDTFGRHNISASFFIEAANHCYFGDRPMCGIVETIQAAGQDTQLMINPCWFYYDNSGAFSKNDSCADRDRGELKAIIEKSVETYQRWAGKMPDAIRAGNCQFDKQFYEIVAELGIPLSSSVGLGMYIAHGKEFLLNNGRSKISGVMEVPLFTYRDKDTMGGFPTKTLQMSSCSWKEMRYILKKARKREIENIVLLTQPFDYIKKKDDQYLEITQNRVNQHRLEKLCSFISEHDQDFVTVDFGSKVHDWKERELGQIRNFKIPTRFRNARKIENLLNDMFWNY